ncbi:glycoside hydrolase family 105 protein [Sphingosinicella sp. BN140058]|uniref:glycoside hydrolase family 88/105 protein n=1 Tax=Sphingosinicella sp. BN140058 TaxID=1892855 RepID=UPI001013C331|nr:glycoside hydrolase family 88 protein [Sphingosinicella sp. BN140058]QAY77954.1 glycosyl hydrolase family 88 [Sphingosinicella sp. BN140058]
MGKARRSRLKSVCAAILLTAGFSPALAQSGSAPAAATPARAREIIAVATRLADWQLQRMRDTDHVARATTETRNPRAWEQAAFWVGMTALADAGGPPRIREAILAVGRDNQWLPARRPYHADDLAITAAYVWAAENGAGAAALAPTRKAFDFILSNPPRVSLAWYLPPSGYDDTECLKRWCWCDALFMAPPPMIALSKITGDPRYRDFAMREYWATTDFLFDPAEHLYYRDSRFFDRRGEDGRKLFWSRGNGWVFASMPRIIPLLEKGSADRKRMESLFVEMAGRLKQLQKADGYWAPSLLSPEKSPPESSGTGFFTYGLAWGIKEGLLDRREYEPAARRGWAALVRAIQPDGRLGWVQQVSDRPEKVEAADTQYYGTGAFLLAATAIAAL